MRIMWATWHWYTLPNTWRLCVTKCLRACHVHKSTNCPRIDGRRRWRKRRTRVSCACTTCNHGRLCAHCHAIMCITHAVLISGWRRIARVRCVVRTRASTVKRNMNWWRRRSADRRHRRRKCDLCWPCACVCSDISLITCDSHPPPQTMIPDPIHRTRRLFRRIYNLWLRSLLSLMLHLRLSSGFATLRLFTGVLWKIFISNFNMKIFDGKILLKFTKFVECEDSWMSSRSTIFNSTLLVNEEKNDQLTLANCAKCVQMRGLC